MEDVPNCAVVSGRRSVSSPRRDEDRITFLVVASSVIASIGGILFGYDIGIVSTALLQLRTKFSLSCYEQEMVVASVVLGAFVGSLVAGSVVDRFGRRRSILGTSLLFIVGSILSACSQDFIMLVISRLIVGIGVALSTAAECTYISEIAPKRWRGMLVSLNELGITVGFLLAFLAGHFLVSTSNGWRYMFGVAAIPGLIQLVGVGCLPPSPYYLILRGNPIKAEEILRKIHPGCEPQLAVEEITSAVLEAKCTSMRQIFGSKDNMRGRMLIGTLLALLQQLTGNSNVLYYAPTIFQQFGYCSDTAATQASVYLGVVKVVTAALALMLIDRLGRRIVLSSGALAMGISVIALGVITVSSNVLPAVDQCSRNFVSPNETSTNTSDYTTTTEYSTASFLPNVITSDEGIFLKHAPRGSLLGEDNGTVTTDDYPEVVGDRFVNSTRNSSNDCAENSGPAWMRTLSIISLMVYISAYEFSFGIGTWLVLSEIFPTKVRGRSVGISTSATWLANVVLSVSFLDTIDGMGIGYTMIMYGAICLLAYLLILLFLPETKQKTLEEISAEFNKGFRIQLTCDSETPRRFRGYPHYPGLEAVGDKNPTENHKGEGREAMTGRPGTPIVTSPVLRTNDVFRNIDLE